MSTKITIVFVFCILSCNALTPSERKEIDTIRASLESINVDPYKKPNFDFSFDLPWKENSTDLILRQLEAAFPNTTEQASVNIASDDDKNIVHDIISELNKVYADTTTNSLVNDSSEQLLYHRSKPVQYLYNDQKNDIPSQTDMLGCSNIFYQYKEIIQHLQELIDTANKRNFNFEKNAFQIKQAKTPPSYLFLRNLHITPNKFQSFYYDKKDNCLTVNVENLRYLKLRDFAKWLIAQKRLVVPLLDIEEKFKVIFSFKYEQFAKPLKEKTKNIYVAKN